MSDRFLTDDLLDEINPIVNKYVYAYDRYCKNDLPTDLLEKISKYGKPVWLRNTEQHSGVCFECGSDNVALETRYIAEVSLPPIFDDSAAPPAAW